MLVSSLGESADPGAYNKKRFVISWERDEPMRTENLMEKMLKRELIEMLRVELEKRSITISEILYYGSEGPYLLARTVEQNQEVFRCCEVSTHSEISANPERIPAAFSDPQFILEAIQTMDLPTSDRCYDRFTIRLAKMALPSFDGNEKPLLYPGKELIVLENTYISSPEVSSRVSGVARREKDVLH